MTTTEQYLEAFNRTWNDETPIEEVRFIVLDSETTGFDIQRDRMITIGAVAVCQGEILLHDSFEVMLKLSHNMASVTIHGITRDEAREGMEEAEALELFLPYLRDGVIVGHHIGHDVQFLNKAFERHFDIQFKNRSLDTMDLMLRLHEDGAFSDLAAPQEFSLDSLCQMFGITTHDRHTAGGDAFLTAQVFIRLYRAAATIGYTTLGHLAKAYEQH